MPWIYQNGTDGTDSFIGPNENGDVTCRYGLLGTPIELSLHEPIIVTFFQDSILVQVFCNEDPFAYCTHWSTGSTCRNGSLDSLNWNRDHQEEVNRA